jgi:hypothetical protein
MYLTLNHRSEIVLNGVAMGYIAIRNENTGLVQRVVKCNTNRDLVLPQATYHIVKEKEVFERDFRAAINHPNKD